MGKENRSEISVINPENKRWSSFDLTNYLIRAAKSQGEGLPDINDMPSHIDMRNTIMGFVAEEIFRRLQAEPNMENGAVVRLGKGDRIYVPDGVRRGNKTSTTLKSGGTLLRDSFRNILGMPIEPHLMEIHSHPGDLPFHSQDLIYIIPISDIIGNNGTRVFSAVLVTPSVRLLILPTSSTMKPNVVDYSKKLHLLGDNYKDEAKEAGLDIKLYRKGEKLPLVQYQIAARLHMIDMLAFTQQFNLATYTSINEQGRKNIFHRSF